MTQVSPRFAWLNNLLGLDKAKEVVADTQQAADQLDGAGVERKEMKQNESAPPQDGTTPPPAEGDMVGQVGAKLAQQIMDAAGGDLSKLSQEQLATVITDALRPAVEAESPAEDASPTEEPDTMPMMEDNNKAAAAPVQDEATKAFSDLLGQMVSDQAAMAKAYATQGEKLEAVQAELAEAKALAPVVEKLVATVNDLKQQMSGRPRQASAADETTVDPQGDAAKALESAIKKGIDGNKRVLGIPVKE